MDLRFPFRNLEPSFLSGLLDDPLLLIKIRPTGSHLLFDCGQLHHLAKRILTRIDAVFISHGHMDHLMGIDLLIRHLHATGKTIDLFGPPGLSEKMMHHFAGYDWNLAESYWSSFRVHDIHPQQISSTLLCGPEQFRCYPLGSKSRENLTIYQNRHLEVEALNCDHRVPSLSFRINEKPAFQVSPEQLKALGLSAGPWIRELKRRFFEGELDQSPLPVLQQDGSTTREIIVDDVSTLCQQIGRKQKTAALGYISDIGFTEENRQKIEDWLTGLDLLICETTFLAADQEKARMSFHLCTTDINLLLKKLRPTWFLPMHLSKTYSRRCAELYREIQPPTGTGILQIPAHTTPRPQLLSDFDWQIWEE